MANIDLFDGTKDVRYGKVLFRSLGELAKYQRVFCSPVPGNIDLPGYHLVKECAKSSLVPGRNQVNLDTLVQAIDRIPSLQNPRQKIVLIEEDAFATGLNWCFGMYKPFRGRDYILMSVNRIRDENMLFDIFCHEIGHMYGAAPYGRSNTTLSLGSHCTNSLCVMQQKMSVSESAAYSSRRHSTGAPAYCMQCALDLQK